MKLENSSIHILLVDSGSGVMKLIALLKPEALKIIHEGTSDSLVEVRYMRYLNDDGGVGFSEMLQFNDETTHIPKARIVSITKASSTLASFFMDYIDKTSRFSAERNIPYYNTLVKNSEIRFN